MFFSNIKKLIILFMIINFNSCGIKKDSLLGDCRQVILVLTSYKASFNAQLYVYEQQSDGWKLVLGSFPAMIGKAGWAWGRSSFFKTPSGLYKREGDMCSPAGIFSMGAAYGYSKKAPALTLWPYIHSHANLIAVDDSHSRFYNRIINSQSVLVKKRDWQSFERMHRLDHLYKWLIEIKHNYNSPKANGGSAIFLHLYRTRLSPTAGCIAISESNMLALLRVLDPAYKPLFILLPIAGPSRLSERVFNILSIPAHKKSNRKFW